MADSKQGGGYSCRFVVQPRELQTECMICLCVLRDPYIVSCCGVKFCQVCINNVDTQNMPCPNCQSRLFNTMADKQLKRQLGERQVHCSNEKRGCNWKGELRQLTAHLDGIQTSNQISIQVVSCPYQDVPCPRCRVMVQRRTVQSHVKDTCPQRDIPCLYEYAGCKVQVRQTTMETHLQKEVTAHSRFLSEYSQNQAEKLKAANTTIQNLRAEINTLKRELSEKIDKNAKDVDKVDKETKELRVSVDYASNSTWAVRWLLIVVAVISIFAVLQQPPKPISDVIIAAIGVAITWLFMPNIISACK